MMEQVDVLAPSDTLADVVDAMVARGCDALLVVENGKVMGVVTKGGVLGVLAERGPEAHVLDALDDAFEIAEPLEMLEPALDRLRVRGGKVLVVMQHGRILGLVTHQGVGEILTMRQAARGRA